MTTTSASEVLALVDDRMNTTSAQVMTTMSASYVFTLVGDWKNNTSASYRGSRQSQAVVGSGSRYQLQLAQGHKL